MYQFRPLFLTIALLGACGGDLANVEEPPCDSRGTLTPGATRSGSLGEANCASLSDVIPGLTTNRDRWTLQLHPDTVDVVEAQYLASTRTGPWWGRLLGYTAEGGDTLLRTGYWGSGGNINGDHLQEMLLASSIDRPVIVHLERATATDSGRYRLEARPCPIVPLTADVATPALPLDDACVLWSAGTPGRARFFSYASDSTVRREVTVTQSDSVALYYAWAAKPPFNFACWYAGGSCDLGGGGKGIFTIQSLSVNGVIVGVIFSSGSRTNVTLWVKVAF